MAAILLLAGAITLLVDINKYKSYTVYDAYMAAAVSSLNLFTINLLLSKINKKLIYR